VSNPSYDQILAILNEYLLEYQGIILNNTYLHNNNHVIKIHNLQLFFFLTLLTSAQRSDWGTPASFQRQ